MKYFWGVFAFVSILFSFAYAQETMPPTLSQNMVEMSLGNSVTVEAGIPVVLRDTKKEQENFVPLPSTWQPDLEMVQISSFGGNLFEVPYLTHIPSFFVYIQILPDKSAVITERVTLILSEQQNVPFVRSYPLVFEDKNGITRSRNIDFLRASYDGKSIAPELKVTQEDMSLIFFASDGLPSGVHLFEISYSLSDAVQQDGFTSRLFLPVLGDALPYLTERLQILVSYPNDASLSVAKAVFGKNNQVQDKAYDVYMDENGHLIYKIKGLLPPMVDVRLDVVGDAKAFDMSSDTSEKINQNVIRYGWLIITIICVLVMFAYFFFTALDVQDKKSDSKYLVRVRSKIFYDIGMLRWFCKHKADAQSVLAYVVHLLQKGFILVVIDKEQKITLTRVCAKKPNWYERRVLRFLFYPFKRNVTLSNLKWRKSLKKLILQNVRHQVMLNLLREILVAGLLVVVTFAALIYLRFSALQIFISMAIISVAYLFCFIYFIHKVQFESLLGRLFKEYTTTRLSDEKKREVNITLSIKEDGCLPIVYNNEKISVNVFEDLFLTQLNDTKGRK